MQPLDTFTEDDLVNLRDEVVKTLSTIRKQLVKKRFKILGKTTLSVLLVAVGAAITVLFPSPLTIAILGAAGVLLGGSNGVKQDVRKVKATASKRKHGKGELRSLENELSARKTKREVMDIVMQQQAPPPTAPQSLYPSL